MRVPAFVVLAFAVVLVAGCSESGPTAYRVQGTVTFKGEPIPYGDILLTPDDAAQNSGPQGIATIENGKFDTAAAGGLATAGGPTVVRVTGLDKQGGKVLCEYEYRVELPRSDSTLNVEVPASAAFGAKRKGPEI